LVTADSTQFGADTPAAVGCTTSAAIGPSKMVSLLTSVKFWMLFRVSLLLLLCREERDRRDRDRGRDRGGDRDRFRDGGRGRGRDRDRFGPPRR
jgi:hypothetical protein